MDYIVGKHVKLRPITLEDTDLIVKWRNSPNVVENFIYRKPLTKEVHIQWMENKVFTGEVIQFVIETFDSSKPIGSVYLRDINRINKSGEYGIFIGDTDCYGKGYDTETAILFTDYCFKTLQLHRIYLRLIKGNERAKNSYIKAGFEHEGTFKDMEYIEGKYYTIEFMTKFNKNE